MYMFILFFLDICVHILQRKNVVKFTLKKYRLCSIFLLYIALFFTVAIRHQIHCAVKAVFQAPGRPGKKESLSAALTV